MLLDVIKIHAKKIFKLITLLLNAENSFNTETLEGFFKEWLPNSLTYTEMYTLDIYRNMVGKETFRAEITNAMVSSGRFQINANGIISIKSKLRINNG